MQTIHPVTTHTVAVDELISLNIVSTSLPTNIIYVRGFLTLYLQRLNIFMDIFFLHTLLYPLRFQVLLKPHPRGIRHNACYTITY